jgi:hypothetical protein
MVVLNIEWIGIWKEMVIGYYLAQLQYSPEAATKTTKYLSGQQAVLFPKINKNNMADARTFHSGAIIVAKKIRFFKSYMVANPENIPVSLYIKFAQRKKNTAHVRKRFSFRLMAITNEAVKLYMTSGKEKDCKCYP